MSLTDRQTDKAKLPEDEFVATAADKTNTMDQGGQNRESEARMSSIRRK